MQNCEYLYHIILDVETCMNLFSTSVNAVPKGCRIIIPCSVYLRLQTVSNGRRRTQRHTARQICKALEILGHQQSEGPKWIIDKPSKAIKKSRMLCEDFTLADEEFNNLDQIQFQILLRAFFTRKKYSDYETVIVVTTNEALKIAAQRNNIQLIESLGNFKQKFPEAFK